MQYLISGLISGVASGLGMGGGVILVVILTYITQYNQQSLQTLNLFYYIPTAIFTILIYIKNKEIDYKKSVEIVAWGIIPTIIAAVIANMIDTSSLRKIFACYLVGIGSAIVIKTIKK